MIVITGAGSGIGKEIALKLAEQHELHLWHLAPDASLGDLTSRLDDIGASYKVSCGDFRLPEVRKDVVSSLTSLEGKLYGFIHAAGWYPRILWEQLTMQATEEILMVNLQSAIEFSLEAGRVLSQSGLGRIVLLSSVLAQTGRRDLLPYIVSKAGVEGLTKALARELGEHGVTVNCIRPGSIEVATELSVVEDPPAMIQRQLNRQCVKRRGQPQDVAALTSFLCSAESAFITGQCINVDGGWVLG